MNKQNKILVLGYSNKLSGGVVKVTQVLLDNMDELELHPVLICYQPRLKSLLLTIRSFLCYSCKLLLQTPRHKAIIVIVGSTGDAIRTMPFIWLASMLGKKIIIQYHKSTDMILDNIKLQIINSIITKTWKSASLHCFLSKSLESLHKKYIGENSKTTVIPNALENKWVNSEILPLSERHRDIVFFGRWSWEKGVDDLLAAMAKIDADITCEIYTNQVPDEQYDKCKILPWVSEEEVHRIMASAKLLVLPSYSEAFPTVLLEAIACGTPFIASNIAGIPDIAEESQSGLIIEAGDVDALVREITRLLEDKDEWKKLSDTNQEWIDSIQTFTVMKQWRRILLS